MVPRTGGHYSEGVIRHIMEDKAEVEFIVGVTYRGEITHNPNDYATKTLPLVQLKRLVG